MKLDKTSRLLTTFEQRHRLDSVFFEYGEAFLDAQSSIVRTIQIDRYGGPEVLRRSRADRQANERVAEKVFGAQMDAGCGR